MSELRVGMVGYGFMGKAHSQAWRNAPRFFDLPLRPELTALCGRDSAAVASAAETYGFAGWETDWRRLIARDDIDVVDICTPGDTHADELKHQFYHYLSDWLSATGLFRFSNLLEMIDYCSI